MAVIEDAFKERTHRVYAECDPRNTPSWKLYYHLQFSPAVKTDVKDVKKNPKRAQRDSKKQTLENGIGTKSQQALKLQQEQNKLMRKERNRKEREKESDRLIVLNGESGTIAKYSFDVANDGGNVHPDSWQVTWRDNCVEAVISGEEQNDNQYVLYFNGEKDSNQLETRKQDTVLD